VRREEEKTKDEVKVEVEVKDEDKIRAVLLRDNSVKLRR
jgi:hypothetical protein